MVPNALHLEASAIDPTRRPEEASWCCPVSEEMIYPFQSSQSIGTRAPFRKADPSILQAIDELNNRRKGSLLRALVTRLGEELSGTTIAVWGLAFKPNTDDMREAPSLVTIEGLLERGARVVAHDPEAMAEAKRRLGDRIELCEHDYAALGGSAALVIHTEWNPYRHPDFDRMKAEMAQPLVFDGRNLYDPQRMAELGFEYYSVGRALGFNRGQAGATWRNE